MHFPFLPCQFVELLCDVVPFSLLLFGILILFFWTVPDCWLSVSALLALVTLVQTDSWFGTGLGLGLGLLQGPTGIYGTYLDVADWISAEC